MTGWGDFIRDKTDMDSDNDKTLKVDTFNSNDIPPNTNTSMEKQMQNGCVMAAIPNAAADLGNDSKLDESEPTREKWTRAIDFIIACVGFSVGLGNVWRFPYLCYKNGGGAFLIPYFTCVLLIGVPIFFLEASLGQFMAQGGINAWLICPLFQGIGAASCVIMGLTNIYYNVILAWAFHYLFASFTSELPWSTCNNAWNTPNCRGGVGPDNTSLSVPGTKFNYTPGENDTRPMAMTFHKANISHTDPVTEYWERKVLQLSSGIDSPGAVRWDLALCLLLAWIIVYFCIWKGIKTSGKVMYFTAPAPYVLMLVLLIRGVTLDGAAEGIKFYLIPDWPKLATKQVWVDAGIQIFFSYSLCVGTVTALGSFNKFNHNCWRDCLIFALTNSGTSLFAGFVIFSILGFMAKENGVSVADVAESGPGLAFIAYPKAVAAMPLAPVWSILFFLMLILLGLDSQFVGVEGFTTAITDMFPPSLRRRHTREIFMAIICCLSFFVGLPMVTEGGMYVFQVMDHYCGSRFVPLIAVLECVVIAWFYGVNRYYDNLEMMIGKRLWPVMKICWLAITPLSALVLFSVSAATYTEVTYNRTYHYPVWGIRLGWAIGSISICVLPLVTICRLSTTSGSLKQRIKHLLQPKLKRHQLRPIDDLSNHIELGTKPSDNSTRT